MSPGARTSLEPLIGAPMPIGEFLPLAIRLAAALSELHGRGTIHGGLEPTSILRDPVTGDIALANPERTAGGAAWTEPSLPYTSPERTGLLGRPIDSRSDLYSLGVVLYALLAGRLPFEARDAIEWVHCHVARQPRPLDAIRPSLPRPLVDIVDKLLAKLPDDRYQSAQGLRHDLERCLGQWRELGALAPFPLGERDVSEELLIPQQLYGRDAERAALREAFERVAGSGTPELVLVSGPAGIGKTALVRELLRAVVGRRGRLIAGKFEQHKREIPYFTIRQALRELARDLLAEGEPGLARWRPRLAQALGPHGKLIVDLVPQLGLIVGPQPPVPELPLTEAETRLRAVFGRLFATCAAAEHPLVMFIDDLQWADTASLQLVAHLLTGGDTHHLLIIGAHRDGELGPSSLLARALEPVRRGGAHVRDLVLGPLSEDDVGRLVADAVRASPAEVAPLARLVRDRTGGNPLFAIQLLSALHHKRSLWFDRDARRWRWDVARVRAEGYTENIAELMRGRLYALPAETQAVLQTAACLGGTVDVATLAAAYGREVAPALRPALEQQLLLEGIDGERRVYRFPHDRVHEAAYALVPERARARIHLQLGRRLLAAAAPEELAEKVFEIVNQLERGAALIEAPAERARLAELYLLAGVRAQTSTAYASALHYLAAGAALIEAAGAARRPELAFAFDLHRAECELMTGAPAAAEPRRAELVRRAASVPDLAAVTLARLALYAMLDRSDLGIEATLEYLRRVGIEYPTHPTADEVRREYDRLWQQLGPRAIEDLIDLPPMTDPDLRATMDVLALAEPPALFTDTNLHALLVCRMVNLSLEHGNSDGACVGYVWLGSLLRPFFGDPEAGFRFGQLGYELLERRGLVRWKARVYLELGVRIMPWTKHLRASVELARRAAEAAKETGDLTFGAYARISLLTLSLGLGEPLAAVQREAEASRALVREAGYGMVIAAMTTQLQLIRSLRGMTRELGSFDDEAFAEDRFEQYLEDQPSHALATCGYWIRKLQARFLAGDHAGALAAADRARPLLWATPSFPESAEYVFHDALARAAHHDDAPEDERPHLREVIAAHHAELAAWAEHGPDNFRGRAALVGAELARVRGEADRAAPLYEQAVRAAGEHGFVQVEAIAYEAAARFHRARGQAMVADAYVREAHDSYARWGAEGKVRQLRRAHPRLEPTPAAPAAVPALRPEHLGRLSLIKASQTISSVMDKDLLSRTLLRFILEESGARRVVLIPLGEGEGELAAEARVDEPDVRVAEVRVPRTVLSYAQRTGEPVRLDAADDAGRFAGDPYFDGARPRSVLCLPVRVRAESVALLYLENELVPGVFTPERLQALEVLATQAAISLENARLLERERAGRIEAEAAEHRELLLGEATALMSQTLDHRGVFDALTHLCARAYVDCAVIDAKERGVMVRIAHAHRDPDKEPILRELAAHYPMRPDSPPPVWQVLRARQVLELPSITDDHIRDASFDAHHTELLRGLGVRSAIVVPLFVRDVLIGVLSLASATSNRFGRADVELAVELGRRMALALDNARLLEETRRALRLREEFLRIASHELRTPLTSLRLSTQALLRAAERNREVSPEVLGQSLRRVLGNTTRLEQLTSELLDVTRIEQGRLELARVEIALDAVVRQAVEHLAPELAAAGSSVEVACAAPVVGRWDPSRLDQVVTNLLTNAAKFGAGKPIEIRIDRRGDAARLAVTDHGIGIDPARLPHVFERFERAVPSSSYGGLGLGLYITRSIVAAHGGTIDVASEPGAGATFTVTLPLAPPERAAAG
jgi:predicted ATPase/signal transduction histidine kinase